MRAGQTHSGGTETDLVVAVRKVPVDSREEKMTTDGRCGDSPHQHLVHRDLRETDPLHNPRDSLVVLETLEDDRVRSTGVQVTETDLERIPVQPGGSGEMGKAGSEHSRSAQRDHRQHRAQKGASHRNGRPTTLSFEGVTDTDHRAWRCARRREVAHYR